MVSRAESVRERMSSSLAEGLPVAHPANAGRELENRCEETGDRRVRRP
jgi:hypothetical protein